MPKFDEMIQKALRESQMLGTPLAVHAMDLAKEANGGVENFEVAATALMVGLGLMLGSLRYTDAEMEKVIRVINKYRDYSSDQSMHSLTASLVKKASGGSN